MQSVRKWTSFGATHALRLIGSLASGTYARGGLISLKNGLINGRRVAVGEINLRAPRAAIMQIQGAEKKRVGRLGVRAAHTYIRILARPPPLAAASGWCGCAPEHFNCDVTVLRGAISCDGAR
jgi:hypothetical protein